MTPCRTASAQHRYGRRHIGITGASTHKFEPAQMGTEATSLRHARDRWSRSAWEMTDYRALSQRKDAEAELKEIANGNEQERSDLAELAQTQTANRKAKLAEQTRQRWANKDRDTKEEPLNDRPGG